ncbi:hypothetical protein CE91St41_36900 [Oscillospiraceae bacterium]|nr:hypothetical protein CE91St40_36880 [Oscillospiraceae bacterium]BDF76801.1 hypothetical protein CE91St41_36900 [Oscillospiraceae bacterium]
MEEKKKHPDKTALSSDGPHHRYNLAVVDGDTVFLVRHICQGYQSVKEVYQNFLKRKIEDIQ